MSTPDPAALTEQEREAIRETLCTGVVGVECDHVAGKTPICNHDADALVPVVGRIIAQREAAAREAGIRQAREGIAVEIRKSVLESDLVVYKVGVIAAANIAQGWEPGEGAECGRQHPGRCVWVGPPSDRMCLQPGEDGA